MIKETHSSLPGHVVVVDDDPAIRATLRDCLEADGYRVTEAGGRAELLAVMAHEQVDLVTLDLRLAGEDGMALTSEIRMLSDVPIIMVTAVDEPHERVAMLEIGADDYVTKPFHVREFLARVASVLRRARRWPIARTDVVGEAERYEFDGWVLDCSRHHLETPDGVACILTASEFTLLRALVRHANRILSRDEIMDLVKGPDWVANDRVIDNQIRRLRLRLASLGAGPDLIRSVRGAGYLLAATIRVS